MNKKFLTILTMMLLAVSLIGCKPSKEEMIANAIKMDWQEIHDDQNSARSEAKYGKGLVKWTGKVDIIDNKYAIMYGDEYLGHLISPIVYVYLSQEDLSKLNKNDTVTVVGKFEMPSNTYININEAILVDSK